MSTMLKAKYRVIVHRRADGALVDALELINDAALLTGKAVLMNHYPADDYSIEVKEVEDEPPAL